MAVVSVFAAFVMVVIAAEVRIGFQLSFEILADGFDDCDQRGQTEEHFSAAALGHVPDMDVVFGGFEDLRDVAGHRQTERRNVRRPL